MANLQQKRAEWWQGTQQGNGTQELEQVGTSLVPDVDVLEQAKQLGRPELQPALGHIEEQPENEDE